MQPRARRLAFLFGLLAAVILAPAADTLAQPAVHPVVWQKAFAGTAYMVRQTADGGFVVAGETQLYGAGGRDVLVMKLDENGDVEWYKTYGGADRDSAYSVEPTPEGGFIVVGSTRSFGPPGTWVLKLSADGEIEWERVYTEGEIYPGGASNVQPTLDGGYALAGSSYSGAGSNDIWVLKLDRLGNIVWQKAYGGPGGEYSWDIKTTRDGDLVVAGFTGTWGQQGDMWIIRLDAWGGIVWQKHYGFWEENGPQDDEAFEIQPTTDGGFLVAGDSRQFYLGPWYDVVMRLDADGNVVWSNFYGYGGELGNWGMSLTATVDDGFAMGTWASGTMPGAWIVRGDKYGQVGQACDFVHPTSTVGQDTSGTTRNTAATSYVSQATVTKVTDPGADVATPVTELCLELYTWARVYSTPNVRDAIDSIQATGDYGFIFSMNAFRFFPDQNYWFIVTRLKGVKAQPIKPD